MQHWSTSPTDLSEEITLLDKQYARDPLRKFGENIALACPLSGSQASHSTAQHAGEKSPILVAP